MNYEKCLFDNIIIMDTIDYGIMIKARTTVNHGPL